MAQAASKNNEGMTLVEVLVALAITFIIFMGLSSAGLVVLNENIKNDMRDEGVSVAALEMGQVRRLPFDTLLGAPDGVRVSYDNVQRQIRGINKTYNVWLTVNQVDANNLQATVEVTWDRVENNRTVAYSDNLATIVRRR